MIAVCNMDIPEVEARQTTRTVLKPVCSSNHGNRRPQSGCVDFAVAPSEVFDWQHNKHQNNRRPNVTQMMCLLNSLHWSDRVMETFNQSTTVNWRADADNWQTLQFTDFLWMPHAEYWWLQHLTDAWDAVIYRCSLNVSLVKNWLMLPFKGASLS